MQDKLFVSIILGTTREGRKSFNAAKLVQKVGEEIEGIEINFIDPREFDLPTDGNKNPKKEKPFADIIEKSDAFFIVTPEYNHGYPPSLKKMLDIGSAYKYFNNKPVAFGGVSNGPWGGVRVIEAITLVTKALGMVPCKKDIHFPFVDEIFNSDGVLLDEDYKRRIEDVYSDLIWKAKVLKWGRENIEF